jgi:hypothetical protein
METLNCWREVEALLPAADADAGSCTEQRSDAGGGLPMTPRQRGFNGEKDSYSNDIS